MLIVMKEDIGSEQIDKLVKYLSNHAVEVQLIKSDNRAVIELNNANESIDKKQLLVFPGVDKVIHLTEPYKLVNKKLINKNTIIKVDNLQIGGDDPVIISSFLFKTSL